MLDREARTAPTVQSAICGGSGVITGSFSESDAKEIALVLKEGALPVDLLIEPGDVPLSGLLHAMQKLASAELAGKVLVVPDV